MTKQPIFMPTADGYDIRAEGVLMLLAHELYAEPCQLSGPGKARIKGFIDDLLSAARVGGFTQSDILHTLLSKNELSPRVRDMVEAAVSAAGNEAIGKLFAALRNH